MRKHFLIFVCVLLGGISGYAFQHEETINVEPTRVLMKNIYGNVVLDHKLHAETYGVDCVTCHDAMIGVTPENVMKVYHELCMGCHEEMGVGPYENDQCNQCHMPQTE